MKPAPGASLTWPPDTLLLSITKALAKAYANAKGFRI